VAYQKLAEELLKLECLEVDKWPPEMLEKNRIML
jgi:hypothetical protein